MAGAALAWAGAVLGPGDREAMDGLALLIFTFVPVRPFAWTFALIFGGMGLNVVRRIVTGRPTLLLTKETLTLPSGVAVSWSDVRAASVTKKDILVVELVSDSGVLKQGYKPGWRRRIGRNSEVGKITISAFELGSNPTDVLQELEVRMGEN